MSKPQPAWRASRRSTLALAAAAGAASWHFGAFPWRDQPLVTDVRHFLYFAQQTANGAWPHLDFFDNKTPLATFAGAALHALGSHLGVEPWHAVRWGYLAVAALAATLAFAVQRALAGGRASAGAFAVALHCGFWLLGSLPSVGNVPKLLMAALASGSALCAHRGAWVAAGLLGGLAALDWQVGALAWFGALAAAGTQPVGRRRQALARVIVAGALPGLALLAVYAWHGAAAELLRQTVQASLFRGAAPRATPGFVQECLRRWRIVETGTAGHTWLLVPAVVGVALYARAVLKGGALRPLTVALGVYHFGILAFSLVDFQGYGDLLALLHSACFFAAVALTAAADLLRAGGAGRRPALAAGLTTIACVLIARPWVSRSVLRPPAPAAAITLRDQRAVAARLAPVLVRPDTAVLGASEQLLLARARTPLRFVFWNAAVYGRYRAGPAEGSMAALARLLSGAGVDRLVCDRGYSHCAGLGPGFVLQERVGSAEGYAVDVYVRRGPAASPRSPAP
jgi:hypothetical protein